MLKVKICGVQDVATVTNLLKRKVDYIGMIFAESKRKVKQAMLQECRVVVESAQQTSTNTKFVAVFLNQPYDEIVSALEQFPFQVVQLHGQETIGDCKKLKRQFPHLKIIKTLSVPVSVIDETMLIQDLQRSISYYRQVVEGFLLDTKVGSQHGGTGISFPWDIVKPIFNNPFRNYQLGIAGGLSAANIDQLLSVISPDFVDINSGVETDGRKDIKKTNQLLNLLEASHNEPCRTIS
ncbi:phosphoribosylanthranilate isomerase [Desulfuribacillus alkaliarsenatis]|uniref:N-(5'-phosphoribosyl)anthranilate isomerase n=1 Tax=Desulfuribacillus alkaliarsenatis TaxID=766136 RepID=A0A1E5G696_9FIRM|nr:phosphoribosylanthranilate isomerase [Desulfuribacillus alkaliarsenatis]OEF98718.1 hypothetical protein BHF68_03400 [Desulfuribacillus alkaliarsenatis]